MSDRLILDVVIALGLAIVVAILIPLLRKRLGQMLLTADEHTVQRLEQDIANQKTAYEARIKEVERRYEERTKELEKQVKFLLSELTKANSEIEKLKSNTQALRQNATPPAPRVLLICGSDDRFCNSDRQALRRANVAFERLVSATKADILRELRRKREDANPWRRVHISAHANDQGILLADGIADPAWWNETLNGVTGIVLAACKTMTVADAIAGLVPYVVAIRENINNEDANQFTFSFWRAVADGLFMPEAFERAIAETPQVAEFVVLRTA
jgi:hypothetical protein